MVVVVHKDTAKILGKPISFDRIPEKYKRLLKDFIPNAPLYFFKQNENVYGCIRKEYGVILK